MHLSLSLSLCLNLSLSLNPSQYIYIYIYVYIYIYIFIYIYIYLIESILSVHVRTHPFSKVAKIQGIMGRSPLYQPMTCWQMIQFAFEYILFQTKDRKPNHLLITGRRESILFIKEFIRYFLLFFLYLHLFYIAY